VSNLRLRVRAPHLKPRLVARRSHEHELLDGASLDPEELRANLRELAMLNRLPGGTATSIEAIETLADGIRDLRILDLGTGGGEMPIAFARHGRRGRAHWKVTAVDNHPSVMGLAERRLAHDPDVTPLLADCRFLPLEDGSVDIAHASLLLHHLEPQDAVAMLAEMCRVARIGVVINDLRRGPLAYAMTGFLVLGLARARYTRHDGLASARRAYSLHELDELLHAAGLSTVWRSPSLMPRVVTAAVGF
jgi:SAM-dependent methyltransferase